MDDESTKNTQAGYHRLANEYVRRISGVRVLTIQAESEK
jgi:hypothetical protein